MISELSHIFNKGNPVKNENLSEFYLWTLLVFCDTILCHGIIWWNDKRFAAGVDRSIIAKGAAMLGVEISDLIRDTLSGMTEVAEEIGLKGSPQTNTGKP